MLLMLWLSEFWNVELITKRALFGALLTVVHYIYWSNWIQFLPSTFIWKVDHSREKMEKKPEGFIDSSMIFMCHRCCEHPYMVCYGVMQRVFLFLRPLVLLHVGLICITFCQSVCSPKDSLMGCNGRKDRPYFQESCYVASCKLEVCILSSCKCVSQW